MNDQLWRLTWALPLVIVIGVGLIYWLKRMGLGVAVMNTSLEPKVLSRVAVSDHTFVVTIEINGQKYLVFESTSQISVMPVDGEGRPLTARSPSEQAHLFPWRPVGRK